MYVNQDSTSKGLLCMIRHVCIDSVWGENFGILSEIFQCVNFSCTRMQHLQRWYLHWKHFLVCFHCIYRLWRCCMHVHTRGQCYSHHFSVLCIMLLICEVQWSLTTIRSLLTWTRSSTFMSPASDVRCVEQLWLIVSVTRYRAMGNAWNRYLLMLIGHKANL